MKKLTLLFLAIILLAFTVGDSKSEYLVPRAAYSIFAGDLDLDGDVDIVTGHKFNGQTSWGGGVFLINDGLGYFDLSDSLFFEYGYTDIDANYIDNNEYPDIFGRHVNNDPHKENIAIIYNYAISQFDSIKIFNLYNNSVVIDDYSNGDVDNDDDIDIVFTCNNDYFWGIIYNDGTGNFSAPEYFDLSYPPLDITCADFNDDGRADVVVAGGTIEVYFSTETGFEQQLLGNTLPWSSSYSLLTSDFDNDNDYDVILSATSNSNHSNVYMFENLGNMQFYEHPYFEFSPFCSYSQIADFNNDSLPDMVFTGFDDEGLYLLYNEGNFLLGNQKFIPNSGGLQFLKHLACADFDFNGFNDIAYVIYNHDFIPFNLVCLFNDGSGNFLENPITNYTNHNTNGQETIKCYPNPFKKYNYIEFLVIEKQKIEITIFDISGQQIISLTNKIYSPSQYKIMWNGTDKNRKEVKPGTYLIRLKTGSQITTERVVKIK